MAKEKRPQKSPPPEPVVSSAWWSNVAFHTTLGALKGLVRGLLVGGLVVLGCIAAHATGAVLLGLFLLSVVGFTVYDGVTAHDRALKADKPKSPSQSKAYDPAKSAEVLHAQGVNVEVKVPEQTAPSPEIAVNQKWGARVNRKWGPQGTSELVASPSPPVPPPGLPPEKGLLPPESPAAPQDGKTAARAQLSALTTRYQDALTREREEGPASNIER